MPKIVLNFPRSISPEQLACFSHSWFAGGYDMSPMIAEKTLEDNRLIIERDTSESGVLSMPWKSANGSRVITTSTLRQRPEPYCLIVELLRGCINRVRNLVAALAGADVTIPADLSARLADLTRQFSKVISEPSCESISPATFDLIDQTSILADQYALLTSEYKLDSRKEANGGPLTMKYGCRIRAPLSPDEAQAYTTTFNAVRIVPIWKIVEPNETQFQWSQLDPLMLWASSAGLDVTFGPLIDLRPDYLPNWLSSWENDLPSLNAFMSDFIGTVHSRYRKQVRTWQLFGGFNHQESLGLSEDDRLRLAGRLLQSSREIDSSAKWSIGISQPWGDYLREGESRYSPLLFADTLLRSGFTIAGLDLDLTESIHLGNNLSRDALDIMHITDQYESLGVPITLTLGGLPTQVAHETGRVQAGASSYSAHGLYWDGWSAEQGVDLPASCLIHQTSEEDSVALRDFRRIRTHWIK